MFTEKHDNTILLLIINEVTISHRIHSCKENYTIVVQKKTHQTLPRRSFTYKSLSVLRHNLFCISLSCFFPLCHTPKCSLIHLPLVGMKTICKAICLIYYSYLNVLQIQIKAFENNKLQIHNFCVCCTVMLYIQFAIFKIVHADLHNDDRGL